MRYFFRYATKIAVCLYFLFPSTVQAAFCVEKGYTIVFVNGIFNSKIEANANAKALQSKMGTNYGGESVVVRVGYNPTHLAGVGDLAQAASQMFGYSISDFDLKTILTQIHPEVTTRKIFLVGHSQGSFYTNAMYDYLLAHGVPKESIGVYNVGTPAASTAGGGKYLTAQQDLMIRLVTDAAVKARGKVPLPPNIDLPFLSADISSAFPGHSFVGAYLTGAPERVVSDISEGLKNLHASGSGAGDCFTVPDATLAYRLQTLAFGVADPTASAVRSGAVLTYEGGVVVFNVAAAAVQKGYALVQNAFGVALAEPVPRSPADEVKDFSVVKSLYGSSLEASDVRDLQAGRQGAAVALGGKVAGAQTSAALEDTFPIRYISRHSKSNTDPTLLHEEQPTTSLPAPTTTHGGIFGASTTPPVLHINECTYSLKKEFCLVPLSQVHVEWEVVPEAERYGLVVNSHEAVLATNTATVVLPDHASSTLRVTAYDTAGTVLTSAERMVFVSSKPLLISEVGWMGTDTSPEDQWLELENRTDYWLDLSHVSLVVGDGVQRIGLGSVGDFYAAFASTTGYSTSHAPMYTFVRSDGVFQNSKIYTSIDYTPVVPFAPLRVSGEELSLVWEMGSTTVVLDKTPAISVCGGWCGGAVASTVRSTPWGVEKSNLSMERAAGSGDGSTAHSWVTNDGYYAALSPTKDRGGKIVLGTPFETNSIQAPAAGFSCQDHPDIVRPGDHVQSAFANCLFYTGFVASSVTRRVTFYVGTEGSSTPLYGGQDVRNEIVFMRGRAGDEVPVAPGTPMFLAITTGLYLYEFSTYLARGAAEHMSPPSSLYRVIPFIYGP